MVVAGCAAADILANNASETQLYADYSRGLVRLVQPADALAEKGIKFLWVVQDPVLKERLPSQLSSIDNRKINICNKAAAEVDRASFLPLQQKINNSGTKMKSFFYQILSHSSAHLWESSRLVGAGVLEQSPDGYLASPLSLRHKIQLLLNTHCNDHMNFDDGSCCSYPEAATTLQLLTFSVLALW